MNRCVKSGTRYCTSCGKPLQYPRQTEPTERCKESVSIQAETTEIPEKIQVHYESVPLKALENMHKEDILKIMMIYILVGRRVRDEI